MYELCTQNLKISLHKNTSYKDIIGVNKNINLFKKIDNWCKFYKYQ